MLAFLLAPFYLLFNLYLFRRIMGWVRAWFPWFRKRKHWAVPAALYAFFALSFVLAFPLPAGRLKRALMLIGNYWLGVLLYLLLAVLLADGLRLLLVHGLKLRSLRSARMHRIAGCLCAAVILATSVGGVINARVVRVTPYEITVNKSAGSMESMKVVLLADLHLGYNVGLAQMERMVARVNEQDADAVVIAGDIFDNAWEAVEEPEQIAAVLRGIRSRYGVYAVYGNHDIEEPILAGFTFRSDGKSRAAPRWTPFSRPRTSASCATRPCCSAARFIFTVAPTRSARGAASRCAKRLRSSSRGWIRTSPFWSLTISRASWRRWPRRAWTSISAGTRTTGRCSPATLPSGYFGRMPAAVSAWGRCTAS